MLVEDNELPGAPDGWVIARAGAMVVLLVTRSRYAAPGIGVVWLAWAMAGGLDAPLPLAG